MGAIRHDNVPTHREQESVPAPWSSFFTGRHFDCQERVARRGAKLAPTGRVTNVTTAKGGPALHPGAFRRPQLHQLPGLYAACNIGAR